MMVRLAKTEHGFIIEKRGHRFKPYLVHLDNQAVNVRLAAFFSSPDMGIIYWVKVPSAPRQREAHSPRHRPPARGESEVS